MTLSLKDKIAVVTGASTGIGLAIAKRFAAEGANVVITGRRQKELDVAVADIGDQASGVRADVSSLQDLDALFQTVKQHHGRIDVLVANAGGGSMAPLGAITEELFDQTFSTNVKGVLFTVHKALPLLADGATVILVGSTSSIHGVPAFSVYSATRRRCATLRGAECLNSRPRHPGQRPLAWLDVDRGLAWARLVRRGESDASIR